ncbi:MAG: M23 family metallopeptidase [Actinomycetota bacterium]|nr:M23 family metallopeptidase [Actinomycetota bacterium]
MPGRSGRHRAARRRRKRAGSGRRRAGPILGSAIILALAFGGTEAFLRNSPAEPSEPAPRPSTTGIAAAPNEAPLPQQGVPFARAKGVTLYLPAAEPELVAYHEASYSDAATLQPIGRLQRNANRTKFDPPPNEDGPRYTVMSSRGRPTPATSAVDVVMAPGTHVRSPVSGVVVQVKPYRLYGRYEDERVEISVDGHPDVHVVMIHLAHVRIRRGDEVSATLSVIGVPRVFPFLSQVDDYVSGGDPHVHIEIKKPSSTAP